MKRLSTFVKTTLLFTGITLLINYFDFEGLVKDTRHTKRQIKKRF